MAHTHNHNNNPDLEKLGRDRKRRYCCCFPSRKSCCWTCGIIFFLLLLAIGLTLGLLWPTIPEYGFSDPYVPTSEENFKVLPKANTFKPGPSFTPSATGLTFTMGLGIDFWLDNSPNRFPIAIDSLSVLGRIQSVSSSYIDSKKANLSVLATDISFPKRTNTTVAIPLQINYDSAFPLDPNDPFLTLIATVCQTPFLGYTPVPPSPRDMRLEFDLDVAPKVLRIFGKSIKTTVGPLGFACPDQLKDAIGVLEGLQNAVGGAVGGLLD
ncbi:hypothetical protein BC832DRAFT_566764 [Gaertneriomyces semiglobifer]|nr:hypothetical protein BC832DRAFT_566764 [Gaertneriomyces semiglobifer]